MDKKDFPKLCRTCLLMTDNLTSVYFDNILTMISTCTNIKICKSENLPDQICRKCYDDIKTSYNFKLQSEKANVLLHKLVDEEEFDNSFKIETETFSNDVAVVNLKQELFVKTEYGSDDDQIDKTDIPPASPVCFDGKDDSCEIPNAVNEPPKYAREYNCSFCEKVFYKISSMAIHIKNQHVYDPVKCSKCRKKFVVQAQLDAHMRRHKKKELFACSICGKVCKKRCLLKRHEIIHKGHKSIPCLKCDVWFVNETNMRYHLNTIHNEARKKFICTACGKQMSTRTSLKTHTLRKHADVKPYACVDCDVSFATEALLKTHAKVHGDGGKTRRNVLCTVCGQMHYSLADLRTHMRIHTGEKPYSCIVCNKKFKRKSQVTEHKKSHTGDRPHECPVCRKKFFTNSLVKRHMLVHTGERPHQCKMCGQTFGQKSTLKTHMKIH